MEMSEHYVTGEKISLEVATKLSEFCVFGAAQGTLSYVFSSWIDLELHRVGDPNKIMEIAHQGAENFLLTEREE